MIDAKVKFETIADALRGPIHVSRNFFPYYCLIVRKAFKIPSCLTIFMLFFILGATQTVLKVIKHCKEFSPSLVTGQLLGLDVGSVLEVTNCFPFPVCSLALFNLMRSYVVLTSVVCFFFPSYVSAFIGTGNSSHLGFFG